MHRRISKAAVHHLYTIESIINAENAHLTGYLRNIGQHEGQPSHGRGENVYESNICRQHMAIGASRDGDARI